MAVVVERIRWVLHPLNAVLWAGALALFLAALLSDIAYFRSYEIQWNNFSSWLLAGGLVIAAIALLCAIVELFRNRGRVWAALAYAALVLATWILAFIDELEHDFVTGFRGDDGLTGGRSVGVSVDPRGALIVADDLSNTVWRVTPNVPSAAAKPAAPGTAGVASSGFVGESQL